MENVHSREKKDVNPIVVLTPRRLDEPKIRLKKFRRGNEKSVNVNSTRNQHNRSKEGKYR